jgi:ribulose-phosphate 3-epimerase
VGPNNIAEIAEAGADTFVAGSAIFNSDDYGVVVDELRARLASVG